MDEIRFNPRPENKPVEPTETVSKTASKSRLRLPTAKIFWLLAGLVGLVLLLFVSYYFWAYQKQARGSDSNYYVFFMADNEVYFGQIKKIDKSEAVLSKVYYLQSNSDSYRQDLFKNNIGTTFSLLKLTSQLHGPTDQIFLNRTNILYYEQLRNDSEVVKLIEQQKN